MSEITQNDYILQPIWQDPEKSLLLTCIRCFLGTSTLPQLETCLAEPISWERFLFLTQLNNVMPVVFDTLKQLEIAKVPTSIREQLQFNFRSNALKNLQNSQELIRLIQVLLDHNIAAIPFKGAVLALVAYGKLSLRSFSDFDILVHKSAIWRAKDILVQLGYTSTVGQGEELSLNDFHLQVPLSHPTKDINVELHWGIPPRNFLSEQDFNFLWENTAILSHDYPEVKILSKENMLVIQGINVAKAPWTSTFIKQLLDLAVLIQSTPDIQWDEAFHIAQRLHCQKLFIISLIMARSILGIELPESVLANHLSSSGAIAKAQSVIALSIWDETSVHNVIQSILYQLTTTDSIPDRVHYAYQLLTMMTRPDERDYDFLPLPKTLHFLYYFVPPLRQYARYQKLLVKQNHPS